jgi:hypothetical protein
MLFFTHILLGILIFKGLTARRIFKSFIVKALNFALLSTIVHTQQTTQPISVFLLQWESQRCSTDAVKTCHFFRFFPLRMIALQSRTYACQACVFSDYVTPVS